MYVIDAQDGEGPMVKAEKAPEEGEAGDFERVQAVVRVDMATLR
jgi:hypothetical protein